jgi:hypothetical protein
MNPRLFKEIKNIKAAKHDGVRFKSRKFRSFQIDNHMKTHKCNHSEIDLKTI